MAKGLAHRLRKAGDHMPPALSSRELRVSAAHAFCLGALMALIALLPAILPYGGRFVTRGDYIEQQLPFLAETRRILRSGSSYSFATFLGAPAVGSYAFYTLGSPFVWPLAFVPQAALPYAVSVMAVLKHAVCALCAFLYLRRMLNDGRYALLGAMLYTFSSFTVVNTQFYHFTEVIAFFPLILLGLEDAMGDSPHPGLLALACGLNALTNYYFMFGSALLSALYFLCRFFSADWRAFRTPRRVLRVLFECAAGCALSGVLLLPALHFMLSITRTGAGDVPLLAQRYSVSLLLERLRALLMPIESGVVHAFFGDAPSWSSTAAYLPVFGLTGVCVFFAARGQRWLKSLLALLLLCSAVPVLCGAFALETNPSYTRWWYGAVLMMTLATLYALRGRPLPSPAWGRAFVGCAVACALLTLPSLLPSSLLETLGEQGGIIARAASFLLHRRAGAYASAEFRILSFALALLGAGVMLCILAKPRPRAMLALVCAVACTQYAVFIAAGDALILSGGETPGSGTTQLEQIASPTLSALELPQQSEYKRIDYGSLLRNYGLLRGQSSLTCFSSLRSSTVGRFVTMAGFGYDESTTVGPPNGSAALRALLSVSEYHRLSGEPVPEGFVYNREENGFPVYTNPNAVPMGFLQTVVTGTNDQPMDSEHTASVLLAAAALDEPYLSRFAQSLPRLNPQAIPDWQTSAARLQENACERFETTPDGFTAAITARDSGLLIFTIPYDKGFSAEVDGVPVEIIPCDVSFMGVWLEPGEHEIAFTYRTRSLRLGIAMSLTAATVLCAYVLRIKKRSPRKRS